MASVEEAEGERAVRLPRLVVRPKDGPAPEGFETPAARAERLVKKHLSVLDRSGGIIQLPANHAYGRE